MHLDAHILLTTFSIPLARALRGKLDRLCSNEHSIRSRISVRAIAEVGIELYESTFGTPNVPTASMLRSLLRDAAKACEARQFSLHFLESEWADVVDAWQIASWEAYRDVQRLGRKTRLGEKQRRLLWSVFDHVRADLQERGLVTLPMVFAASTRLIENGEATAADFVVVDEAQDITVPQLRFLSAVAGRKENGLFFAGDLGQRIFQTPFSWASLGVDVRGRSQTLRLNYRTSHQIRQRADRLLNPELSDVDGNTESRAGTISAFNGPEPLIQVAESTQEESQLIASWLNDRTQEGATPEELAVFVRSDVELPRARNAVAKAGLKVVQLDASTDTVSGHVSICPMHLAKGLEFRAVVVAACDDEVLPLQARIETVADDGDLEEVYNTERHLFYVACTRARDHLLITGVAPASEFLDDLRDQ